MPIRFRCEHCNQLLGIARRKAGTYVHCPTCRTAVLVPQESAPSSEEAVAAPPRPPEPPPTAGTVPATAPTGGQDAGHGSPPSLFERDDFDVLLRGSGAIAPVPGTERQVVEHPGTPLPPARPAPLPQSREVYPPTGARPGVAVENAPAPWPAADAYPAVPEGVGLVLSPARATFLTVVVILLLAFSFGAGLLVGRFYLGQG